MIKHYTAIYAQDYVYIKELDQVFQVNGLGDWILLDRLEYPEIYEAVKQRASA